MHPAAWLTINDRDNEPGVFWRHVFFALAFVGAIAPDAPPPMVSTAPAVDELGELLFGAGGMAVLVLDAADRLQNPTIFDQLGRLLEGAGERLRLVMTTRRILRCRFTDIAWRGHSRRFATTRSPSTATRSRGCSPCTALPCRTSRWKTWWSAPKAGQRVFD